MIRDSTARGTRSTISLPTVYEALGVTHTNSLLSVCDSVYWIIKILHLTLPIVWGILHAQVKVYNYSDVQLSVVTYNITFT